MLYKYRSIKIIASKLNVCVRQFSESIHTTYIFIRKSMQARSSELSKWTVLSTGCYIIYKVTHTLIPTKCSMRSTQYI